MRPHWKITDAEWKKLHGKLVDDDSDKERVAAEACLFRYFHMLTNRYSTFGWNELPKSFDLSPISVNRRYREWTGSGKWLDFWDALMEFRHGKPRVPRKQIVGQLNSPLPALISELERAFIYFNARFFGGTLTNDVVIGVEPPSSERVDGYYCSRRWKKGRHSLSHIAITTNCLGGPPSDALHVLLHEMVHLRNDQYGLKDTHPRSQYHNRFFRDVAEIVGLTCGERHPERGYAYTALNSRGKQAIKLLQPERGPFKWDATKGRRAK